MTTFANDEDVSNIYKLEYIFGFKVKIEPLRKPRLVPQYKNCQLFVHTQSYCNREPQCVKCTGKHYYKTVKMLAEELKNLNVQIAMKSIQRATEDVLLQKHSRQEEIK